ncbi:hypothetical protein ACFCWT_28550 [Streptomyces olivaceus]|uniref:hypothetical protein n=1 Tax=Streptomyces olivaceus TaxID=47716 RepID=UPI0035E10172
MAERQRTEVGTKGGLLVRSVARRGYRGRTAPLSAPPVRTRHADHTVPADPEGTDFCVVPGPSAPDLL